MTHDEMIAVIQAHKDGMQLQVRDRHVQQRTWKDDLDPRFDFLVGEYRIKPTPREFWISPELGALTFVKETPQPGWVHVQEVLD
jgi:hypothetical protein